MVFEGVLPTTCLLDPLSVFAYCIYMEGSEMLELSCSEFLPEKVGLPGQLTWPAGRAILMHGLDRHLPGGSMSIGAPC